MWREGQKRRATQCGSGRARHLIDRIRNKKGEPTLGGCMGEAHTRVISLEAHDNVAIGPDDEGISSHGHARVVALRETLVLKSTSFLFRAVNGLEGVAVKMEGVAARVEVVDDNLDNLALLQDKGMGELAVDGSVVGEVTGGHGSVQGGNFGLGVSDVVEEGIVLSVAKVVHDDIELDDLIRLWQQLHLVIWHKPHVVKGVELVDKGRLRKSGLGVVGQPTSDVVVEIIWQGIKESL